MRRLQGSIARRSSHGMGLKGVVSLLTSVFLVGCQGPSTASPSKPPSPTQQAAQAPTQPAAQGPTEPTKEPAVTQAQPLSEPSVAVQQSVAPRQAAPAQQPVAKLPPAVSPPTVPTQAGLHEAAAAAEVKPALPKGPKLVVEKAQFDLGEVSTNSKNTAVFKLTNAGDALLEITDVTKCCGANVQLEKQKLEPGESTTLTGEYYSGEDVGQWKKQLVVHSNDAANPSIPLTVVGKVVQRLVSKPSQLKLFLNKDNFGCGDLVISALDGKPFSVKGYLCTGDCITMDYDPNAQATEFVLKPKVSKEKLVGLEFPKGTLQIKLTRQDRDLLQIPFDLLPNYSVTPSQVILFNAEPGKKETRKIHILDNYVTDGNQAEFAIESVNSQNQIVSVGTTRKIKDGYEIIIEINPAAPKEGERSFSDEVVIKTKDGEEMKVTLRGFYAAKVLSSAKPGTAP